MKIGFTGTREGMTAQQRDVVEKLLTQARDEHSLVSFHHGDCVGADAESYQLARALGIAIFVHPPNDTRLRAYCTEGATKIFEPLPYLERNRNIVKMCDVLLATPKEERDAIDTASGGTWYTIRFAERLERRILVVWPDGRLEKLRD